MGAERGSSVTLLPPPPVQTERQTDKNTHTQTIPPPPHTHAHIKSTLSAIFPLLPVIALRIDRNGTNMLTQVEILWQEVAIYRVDLMLVRLKIGLSFGQRCN